jgi:hypothetical protein
MHANTSVAAGMQSASKAMGAMNKVMSCARDLSDVCNSNMSLYFMQ